VNNGMAMCKIHHAAYDQHLISVTAEYREAVLRSVLEDFDGPTVAREHDRCDATHV
jgi:putative restriction endonuclease